MNFDELRKAIEAMRHDENCCAVAINRRHVVPCNCRKARALSALSILEREYVERERRLREEVLEVLNDGFFEESPAIYDAQTVNFAHRKLAEILDLPKEEK